jgi:hypothetical protein
MAIKQLSQLADFGIRSLLTHGIMAVSFIGAVISGLYIEGQIGLISFVAFVNFTAGMWICQSIHAFGAAAGGSSYNGVLSEVRDYVQ